VEKLESLEKEVKHSIAQIEKDIDDIDREIARYENRVEKQREILVQYNLKDTEE
jgi:peptidoglycan hydrolase CwlO-like protein